MDGATPCGALNKDLHNDRNRKTRKRRGTNRSHTGRRREPKRPRPTCERTDAHTVEEKLPAEMWHLALSFLPDGQRFVPRLVCKTWRALLPRDTVDPREGLAAAGEHRLLTWLHDALGIPWCAGACAAAAGAGRIDCLMRLHLAGCRWDFLAYTAAAEAGHPDCLRYLFEHDERPRLSARSHRPAECDAEVRLDGGAQEGRVRDPQRCRNRNARETYRFYDRNAVVAAAARGANVECLEYLHARGLFSYQENLPPYVSRGYRYAIVAEIAARADLFAVLDWLVDKLFRADIADAWQYAAFTGRTDVLDSLERTAAYDPDPERTRNQAAGGGKIGALEWFAARGYAFTADACVYAATYGRLDALRWLRERGVPWDVKTCTFAARHGKLDCLLWAVGNGCPWKERKLRRAAARSGSAEVVAWMVARGSRFDETDCQNALDTYGPKALAVLRDHGAPWDARILSAARRLQNGPALLWALDNGCPWDGRRIIKLVRRKDDMERMFSNIPFEEIGKGPKMQDDPAWVMRELLRRAPAGPDARLADPALYVKAVNLEWGNEGHVLELVDWLHQHGCPLDRRACEAAAAKRYARVLKRLRRWESPRRDRVYDVARGSGPG